MEIITAGHMPTLWAKDYNFKIPNG